MKLIFVYLAEKNKKMYQIKPQIAVKDSGKVIEFYFEQMGRTLGSADDEGILESLAVKIDQDSS